jgi:hypothetical protein
MKTQHKEPQIGKSIKVSMGEDMPETEAHAIVTQLDGDRVRVLVTTGYFTGCYISIYEHDILEEGGDTE